MTPDQNTLNNATRAHRALVTIMHHVDNSRGYPFEVDEPCAASLLAERFAANLSDHTIYPLTFRMAGVSDTCETGTYRCGCGHCQCSRVIDDSPALWSHLPLSAV